MSGYILLNHKVIGIFKFCPLFPSSDFLQNLTEPFYRTFKDRQRILVTKRHSIFTPHKIFDLIQQSRFIVSVSSFILAIKMFLWNAASMHLTCLIYISRIEFVARMSLPQNLMAIYLDVDGIRIVSMKLLFFRNNVWIATTCTRFFPKDYNFFCYMQLKLYDIYIIYIYVYICMYIYIYICIYIYKYICIYIYIYTSAHE